MTEERTRLALLRFIARYQRAHQEKYNTPARTACDADWRSACETGAPDDNMRVRWQPAVQHHTSLADLEQALAINLHPTITSYYTSVWFPGLGAIFNGDELDLIGLWNAADLDNLQANIIGHALQQRRAKLPMTVFFALPLPDSEYCLAIENHSGAVVLEPVGRAPERTIAASLAEFLDRLQPRFDPD